MGYSARYHAASLAAVFLALAIGILIGVGFGDDIVSGTAEDLERSLESDLTDARERIDELEAELARERELGELLYPAVVGEQLQGERIALVAFGGLGDDISADIEEALEPTDATLREVAVVTEPPDVDAAIDALAGNRARRASVGEALEIAARRGGAALATGGPRFDALRRTLLARYSGSPGPTDAAIVVRTRPEGLSPRAAATADRLEEGLVDGLRSAGMTVVGAERSDAESSSVPAFEENGLASVDDVDLLAGRVALVLALAGAEGSFGVKETADRFLPELLPSVAGEGG